MKLKISAPVKAPAPVVINPDPTTIAGANVANAMMPKVDVNVNLSVKMPAILEGTANVALPIVDLLRDAGAVMDGVVAATEEASATALQFAAVLAATG